MTLEINSHILSRRLSPQHPLWQWAQEAISERAREMLRHLPDVCRGDDIEAVHDMRVASRRTAAAMRLFGDCFPEKTYRDLYREARGVTKALGKVRDQDVLLEHFSPRVTRGLAERQAATAYVVAYCGDIRERARRPMLGRLKALAQSDFPIAVSRHLARRADDFRAAALGIRSNGATPGAEETLTEAAARILPARCDAVMSWCDLAGQEEAEAAQHSMRIKVKWLRYTCELFAPAYGDGLAEELTALKKLQSSLGDLHDADMRRELVTQLREGPLSLDAVWRAGEFNPARLREGLDQLREREDRRRQKRYEEFRALWRELGGWEFLNRLRTRLQQPEAAAAALEENDHE